MKSIIKFLALAFWICLSYQDMAQTPATDQHWQLIWQDSFSTGPYVNQTKWRFDNQQNKDDISLISRRDSEHYIDSGILNLMIIKKDTVAFFGNDSIGNPIIKPVHYMSGDLISRQFFRYGFFEMRWRLRHPDGTPVDSIHSKAVAPAFWLWSDASNPAVPDSTPGHNIHNEIDIFETMYDTTSGGTGWTTQTHNLHHQDTANATYYSFLSERNDKFYYDRRGDVANWHTYACEWDSSSVRFYLDGQPFHRFNNGDKSSPSGTGFSQESLLRHMAIYLTFKPGICRVDMPLVNFEYQKFNPDTNNVFPVAFQIDYVKVWQLGGDCGNSINQLNYNWSTHAHNVYQTFKVGGSGGSAIIPNNSTLTVRASEEITLDEGFDSGTNTDFYADINPCIP